MDYGVDPRAMDDMSLYEIISMQQALARRGKPVVTDEEFDEGMELMRSVLSRDPTVRLKNADR